ncbi:MAG TPA: hypothetical protein VMS31_06445, partial [Pyrinomonadaceae bacterium]|nr:hypothetical protein [Pyrinomonadaceae bacterium]
DCSPRQRATAEKSVETIARCPRLTLSLGYSTWGSTSLHPRPYAIARYRGLGTSSCSVSHSINFDSLY